MRLRVFFLAKDPECAESRRQLSPAAVRGCSPVRICRQFAKAAHLRCWHQGVQISGFSICRCLFLLSDCCEVRQALRGWADCVFVCTFFPPPPEWIRALFVFSKPCYSYFRLFSLHSVEQELSIAGNVWACDTWVRINIQRNTWFGVFFVLCDQWQLTTVALDGWLIKGTLKTDLLNRAMVCLGLIKRALP